MTGMRFSYTEPLATFWTRHLLNRLRKRPAQELRLCAFPDDLIGREIAVAGTYEAAGLAAMQWLCDTGVVQSPAASVFLDIGANVGIYTLTLAPRFAQTLAFEPHPVVNRVLELNADINGPLDVSIVRCGLSDAECIAELSEGVPGNLGASSLERATAAARKYAIHLRRGDDVVREMTKSTVALVKIDVEGHEPKVIAGLSQVLCRDQPVVAFEANDDMHNQEIADLLASLGYVRFLALDWSPSIPWPWLRVIVLTLAGAKTALKPVDDIRRTKYSLVFALPPDAAARWEQATQP